MDAGDVLGMLGGATFGASALKVGEVLFRRVLAARARKAMADAQVQLRAVDADVTALQLLADRVRGLEAAQVQDREKCDEKLEESRRKHEMCEQRLAALDGEFREFRRELGIRRPDDTPRHGFPAGTPPRPPRKDPR